MGSGWLAEQFLDGHDHAGGAEAALEAVFVPEGFLHGVELAVGGEAFDGGDAAAIGLDREQGAGFDGAAFEHDGAGAADGSFAADVGAGEAGDVAEVMDEEQARLDFIFARAAVDGEGDFFGHTGGREEGSRKVGVDQTRAGRSISPQRR